MFRSLCGFHYTFLQVRTKGVLNLHFLLLWEREIAFASLQRWVLSEHTCVFTPEACDDAEHRKGIFNISLILEG